MISLLEEVCRRYMQYYQQLLDMVASFGCVAGLRNPAPHVNLALKAMSKHFRCLKDAIMDQLQFTSKGHEKLADSKDDMAWFGTVERTRLGYRVNKNSGYLQQPVWLPRRGLPEHAVTVLRACYPTDTDKLMLAKQTGLSQFQEIHILETQQVQASQITCRDKRSITQTSNDHPQMSSSVPSASVTRMCALTSDLSTMRDEQAGYLSHVVVGESIGNGTSSGATLSSGLHPDRLRIAVETTGMSSVGHGRPPNNFSI